MPESAYQDRVAVLYEGSGDADDFKNLALRLDVPLLVEPYRTIAPDQFYLSWRDGRLKLLDQLALKRGGYSVEFDVRGELQRSWPAPKKGPLAQAVGRKTRTVVDATAGWGQDAFYIFRMGYTVCCIERSPVMAELLQDGFARLAKQHWMQHLGLVPPRLLSGEAMELMKSLETPPDAIYLDPMFPPKRKKSALAKKTMTMLRDILGHDEDRQQLFSAAMRAAGKRVIVKSPDYAEPLGGKPDQSFQGKLVRYDVYNAK